MQLSLFEPINLIQEQQDQALALELAIEDALFRIRRDYERCEGNIYLSFSGGKDSTVLAHLIMMANLPTHIPFLFSNTGIELDATVRFVKAFPYDNVQLLKPKKPFAQIIREYGKPTLSKLKSEALSTYQKSIDDPFKTSRSFQLIRGTRLKNWQLVAGRTDYKLANKHLHFIHPDTEFKVANKCCSLLKKEPFQAFEEANDSLGAFSGVRVAEGGARALAYDSCVKVKQKRGKDFIFSMPIIDWTDEMLELFIKTYNIQLSDAYQVYGLKRTGCCACPYSQNLSHELKVLHDYEPNRYKAMMHWLKDVYIYQDVRCDFDPAYVQEYLQRQPIIEQRRHSMLQKFRNPLKQRFFSLLSFLKTTQDLYDEFEAKDDVLRMKLGEDGVYRSEFESNYTQLKTERNVLDHVKGLFTQLTKTVEKEDGDQWTLELREIPSFYATILSQQGSSEVPDHTYLLAQQHPEGMTYYYRNQIITSAEFRRMKFAQLKR